MTLTVTDFFAGAGGSSEGLRQAGYHVQACANRRGIGCSPIGNVPAGRDSPTATSSPGLRPR